MTELEAPFLANVLLFLNKREDVVHLAQTCRKGQKAVLMLRVNPIIVSGNKKFPDSLSFEEVISLFPNINTLRVGRERDLVEIKKLPEQITGVVVERFDEDNVDKDDPEQCVFSWRELSGSTNSLHEMPNLISPSSPT